MKSKILLSGVGLLLICQSLSAREIQNISWAHESAFITLPGSIEKGLFGPLYYGLSDCYELSSHIFANPLIPNLNLKWSHRIPGKFSLASVHSFFYPTPLLRLLARKGIGGIISPEFKIPSLLGLYNGIIISKSMPANQIVSWKLGINIGLKSAQLDDRTTIDLPLVYPRLMPFYHGYGIRIGGDYRKNYNQRISLLIDYDVFMFPGASEGFAVENKSLFFWYSSERTQFSIGYKLIYGKYPFGSQWHLLFPIFNIQRAWQLKK